MRTAIALFLVAALLSCEKEKPSAPAGGGGGAAAKWLTSYDEALAQAKSSGKPILADFGAPW